MATICAWNVNGLRAAVRTGDFPRWMEETAPDIAGLQEVKAQPDQLDDSPWREAGYEIVWHPAERPGYSGAMLLAKRPPDAVRTGLATREYEREGRVIEADYGDLTLITSYFPNAGRKLERLDFKLAYYDAFLAHIERLRAEGRRVLFMGDLNVAHTEMDVARPAEAAKGSGFRPEERAFVDRLLEQGYVDTFRALHPDERDAYTFWDPWRERRQRNIGWRIDYVFVAEELMPLVRRAFIQPEVMGSDHCPVGVEIDVDL